MGGEGALTPIDKSNMGGGASKQIKKATAKVAAEEMQDTDGSDIKTLAEAKEEIQRLRQQLAAISAGDAPRLTKQKSGVKGGRAAVVARAAEKDYVKKTVPKSDDVRKLIQNAIKSNTLFRACSEEELIDLVDAFDSAEFDKGAVVIQQGDEGEHFYVVESGNLDITVRMADDDSTATTATAEKSGEVHVGVPYVPGSAFGELALMYGSPRAATIRANSDCKLWSIGRNAFKGITGQHKVKRAEMHLQFLRKVQIGDKVLGDVLKPEDIDAMALATQQDSFSKGDVVVREGERGDVFYLIESGTVEVYKNEAGDDPVATLSSGQFFGERALLSEDVRQATCIASSDVKCLYLMREDFVLMLGNLQDLLDGKVQSDGYDENPATPSKDQDDAAAGEVVK